jgi:hypothetical protein
MELTDHAIEILKGIRDETRKTNEGLYVLRAELSREMIEARAELSTEMGELRAELRGEMSELRADLRDRFERVEHRRMETEIRLATQLVAVAGAVRDVRDLLREDRVLRQRVDEHEKRISALERGAG